MKDVIRIRQATKVGYIEVPRGGVFDGKYINSKTRRGRYQHELAPTLIANNELYYYEGAEEQ